jgi:hypothetical protein
VSPSQIRKFDMQTGDHFRIGRIPADGILKGSDRLVDRAGRIIILPMLEKLGRR